MNITLLEKMALLRFRLAVLYRWLRSTTRADWLESLKDLRIWWFRKYVTTVEHEEVVEHVRSEGRLTSRYSFMVTMSCAIAILGLLLSSPAVVIGAMLISPLMGPIISLGFSLCLLDIRQMRKALEGVVAGCFLALAISWLIVTLSPLTDATPEIMSRTRPNLFDLLVAIFSGLAGGYAVIKRKGETIVGVAIATALMPPLAVIGFGLATGSGSIASGAFMLFMTNLLAIALSVTLLTKFYGFGRKHSPTHTAWQMALVLLVFGALSLPLGVALRDIAYQTYVTNVSKATIKEYFGHKSSRISMFSITFPKAGGAVIDAAILTPQYIPNASKELKLALAEKTNAEITLSLDQIVVTRESIQDAKELTMPEAPASTALQVPSTRLSLREEMVAALKQASFFPIEFIRVETEKRLTSIHPKPAKGVTLATLHQFEVNLAQRYPEWTIQVVPPYQSLPPIYFDIGGRTPNKDGMEMLDDIIWALKRWNAEEATVIGFASTVGEFESFNNYSLAYRRASYVVKALETAGITAQSRSEYRSFRQEHEERALGINNFHRVEVRLIKIREEEEIEIPQAATQVKSEKEAVLAAEAQAGAKEPASLQSSKADSEGDIPAALPVVKDSEDSGGL